MSEINSPLVDLLEFHGRIYFRMGMAATNPAIDR